MVKLNEIKENKKTRIPLIKKDQCENNQRTCGVNNDNKVVDKKNKKCKFRYLFIFIFLFIFIYLALIIGAKRLETSLTFPGVHLYIQDVVGHTEANINFEDINIKDKDGNNINGLYLEYNEEAKTVYYFHGNGGPLSYFYSEIKYINELGYNVMAFDYPGYGKSTGFPYKENVDEFSAKFFEYMSKYKKINNNDLIVWGYSVGTAVATDFASKNDFNKLILVSPLSSRYDYATKLFGFPLQKYLFLSDSYKTKDLIKNIKQPVLIIHGNNDKVVSFDQGQKVFQNIGVNNYVDPVYVENGIKTIEKQFIEIDDFGHNYIIDFYGKSLKGFFVDFLRTGDLNFKNNYFKITSENKIILEEENKQIDLINSFDLNSDNSIQKFVTSSKSFNDKSYIPKNLEKIESDTVYDTKGGRQILNKETNKKLQKMGSKFFTDLGIELSVVSAYRSYNYQKGIKARGCPDNLCAKAGYSEHQSGLAVDLFEASNQASWESNSKLIKYSKWLSENAHTFGFHNTYQKGLEIDGYEIEPWHFRYLGVELATYLKDNNITIAEFYFNNKK